MTPILDLKKESFNNRRDRLLDLLTDSFEKNIHMDKMI